MTPGSAAKRRPGPAKRRSSTADAAPNSRSSLYDRANGFSLGCFLALIRYKFARRDYRFHRARIMEFAAEAELSFAVPSSQRTYDQVADRVLQEAVLGCKLESPELADFVLLGAMAVIDATLRLSDEPVIEDMRTEAIDIMVRHALDGGKLYERYLAYVRKLADEAKEAGDNDVKIDTFLTPAMDLLTGVLEPLPQDDAMCFVAMPFKRPYAGYFASFYRPLAQAMECRVFRMWGGLSGEAYVELMLTVMRRCRVVIADLSDVNGNVLYEFGVAKGLGKRVVPLCRRVFGDQLPSNIASDQMLQVYSPREKEWPAGTAYRCAAQVALIDFSLELAEKSIADAKWAEGARLPQPGDLT